MENLLKKLARSYNQTTGLDYEDLFQEANVAYIEALRTHDPSRGALTTHVWYCVSNRLKNYIKKEQEEIGTVPIEECNQIVSITPFWEKLSKDAQFVTESILCSPRRFLKLNKIHAQIIVISALIENGWDEKRIGNTIVELMKEFSS
jgi:RNA polymerase sigma factor (sigma-70 family)